MCNAVVIVMDRFPRCNGRHAVTIQSSNVQPAVEILSNPVDALKGLLQHVTDVIMPHECFVCGSAAGGEAVCPACRGELPRRPGRACPVCALPVVDGGVCGRCARQPPAFDATWAVFDYAFPVDAMLHALKYRHQLALAGFFARELAGLAGDPWRGVDMILPMPLHAHRLAERGFNQAVEIARPLARANGLPLELAAIRRVRNTVAQAGLDREARLRNPRGAFEGVRPLAGVRILVVDDVMTTGATLNELARALKRQGAGWVGNLVIARTPTPD